MESEQKSSTLRALFEFVCLDLWRAAQLNTLTGTVRSIVRFNPEESLLQRCGHRPAQRWDGPLLTEITGET
jgi:hypothetical protein